MIGVRHLVDSPIGRELDAAIVCEPEENELCLEQRGVVWARFRVRGKMAHGAMPEAGINPISCLACHPPRSAGARAAPAAVCERSRHLRPPTVTPTVIQGPARVGVPQSNVIPAAMAELVLDVRLTPGIDAEGMRDRAEAIVPRGRRRLSSATEVEWEAINSFRLATGSDQVRGAGAGDDRRREGGRRPVATIRRVPGSTDGTILRMELGIPIVTCGPGEPADSHQVNEYDRCGRDRRSSTHLCRISAELPSKRSGSRRWPRTGSQSSAISGGVPRRAGRGLSAHAWPCGISECASPIGVDINHIAGSDAIKRSSSEALVTEEAAFAAATFVAGC